MDNFESFDRLWMDDDTSVEHMSDVSEHAGSSKVLKDVEKYRDEEDTQSGDEEKVDTSGWMGYEDNAASKIKEEKERRLTPRVDDMVSCIHPDLMEKEVGMYTWLQDCHVLLHQPASQCITNRLLRDVFGRDKGWI